MILKLLRSRPSTWRIRGVTDGRYKLIEYASGKTQLFDLDNDPLEMHALAEHEASSVILTQMRQSLRNLSMEWDDQGHPTGMEFWNRRTAL